MGDDLNVKVRDWAQAQANSKQRVYLLDEKNRKVGKGECWDLAEQALKENGAMTSNDLGSVTPGSNYVWGDAIGDVRQVIPGDILQFRDHKVTTKTETKVTFQDGTVVKTTDETFAIRGPQHTAIVNSKITEDGSVEIFEQHVRPAPGVQLHRAYLTEANPARPPRKSELQKHPKSGKFESADVTTTVTIEVKGEVRAYRPKSR